MVKKKWVFWGTASRDKESVRNLAKEWRKMGLFPSGIRVRRGWFGISTRLKGDRGRDWGIFVTEKDQQERYRKASQKKK